MNIAEHVGMPADELRVHPARDIGDGERAGFRREHRLDHHLEQQVTELVFEGVVRADRDVATGRVGRQFLDRLHHFVGLFEHVPAKRVVRLGLIPRATTRTAQALGEREQAHELGPDRDVPGVDEQRGEVVGLDVSVDIGQGDGEHLLVGEAEALEHRHFVLGRQRLEERELHLGAHELRIALGNQHRSARPGCVDRERATVDHTRAVHRVDTQAPPREIDERDTGDQLDVDTGRAHELDAALGDRRAAGNGVDDLALLTRGLDHPIGNRGIDRVEIVGAVVEQIERLERDAVTCEVVDGGMTRGAHESDRHALECGARRGQQQVGARGPEPDNDDARLARHYGVPGAELEGATVVEGVVPSRFVLGFGASGAVTW